MMGLLSSLSLVKRPFKNSDGERIPSAAAAPSSSSAPVARTSVDAELPAYTAGAFTTFHDRVSPKEYGVPLNTVSRVPDEYVVALYDYKRYIFCAGAWLTA